MRLAPCLLRVLVLMLWIQPCAWAQDLNAVRFQRYGIEDGLSQTTVRALYQDSQGFVWLGTQDGLNRFDGYEFRVYRNDPAKTNTLGDNHIVAMEHAAGPGFWTGTLSGGLARYRPETDDFKRFKADGKFGDIANNGISALFLDRNKRFWVGTSIGSLQWFNEKQAMFENVASVNADSVGRIKSLIDHGDGLLMGTRNGIFFLKNENAQPQAWPSQSPLNTEIEKMAASPDGKEVWVATLEQGLYRFSLSGQLLQQIRRGDGLAHDNVRDLKFDRFNRLWLATFDGLSRIDRPNGEIKTWRYESGNTSSLSANRTEPLMEDREGLMWVGTWMNGVNLFIPRTESFKEINAQSKTPFTLPSSVVPGIFVDVDYTLWLAVSEGGGLIHYDMKKGVLQRFVNQPDNPASLPAGVVQNVVRDRKGVLWIATGAGLARMRADGKNFDIFRNDKNNPDSLPYTAVQRVFADSRGTLWIGTAGGGVASRCETCDKFKRHPVPDNNNTGKPNSSVSNDFINIFYEDSKGYIWFGLRPGGLVKLDPQNGVMQRFRGEPGKADQLSHDSVTTIFEDSKKRFWIGTQGGGLNLMTINADGSGRFKHFDTKNGLAANAIGAMQEDANGNLWVSTTSGLSRISSGLDQVENFGTRDGVQGIGYFIGAKGLLPDGRMLFSGLRGITVFNPREINSLRTAYRAQLTALRVLKSNAKQSDVKPFVYSHQPSGDRLNLEVGADDINIEFSALSFADPHKLHYAYRMLGANEQWQETDSIRRMATFNNLKPGDYQFELKVRNDNAQWGEVFKMPVHLPSPWWASLWAKAVYFLLGVGLVAVFVWNVGSRLRERERAQAVIRESEQRLKLTLWGTGDELWDMDIEHDSIHRSNPLLILKGSTGDFTSNARSLNQYIHPEDIGIFENSMREHMKGNTETFDATFRTEATTGGWRWVRMRGRVTERSSSGRALRMAGTTGDITELKQHEIDLAEMNGELEQRVGQRTDALTRLNKDLQETIDQLKLTQQQLVESEKMAALGGLVAGVAHEINTPLGIGVTAASFLEGEVKRLNQLLFDKELSKSDIETFGRNATESSQLILRNLYRADKLVKSFKQVAVDQSSEETRKINLHAYVEEVLVSLQPAIKKSTHEVNVYCKEVLLFETYPGAIYQILVNLLMNAILHAFPDQTKGKIDILISRDMDMVLLEFCDNGCGMTEDIRRRVFEPFFTTKRGVGGSGLGLHIAWNLATQLLGGSLSCESKSGQGTSFYLRIPMKA